MSARQAFDYVVIRVVPRVEREEFVNAAVVLHCPAAAFLGCRVHLDEPALRALAPDADIGPMQRHLSAVSAICAGHPDAGPIARLSASQRFHWLSAPRNTLLQPSPVHAGLADDPAAVLEHLFRTLVLRGRA